MIIDAYKDEVEEINPDYLKKNLIVDGQNSDAVEHGHFFAITNANHILGEALSDEDLRGLEKAILGSSALERKEEDREEEHKKRQ